MTRRLIATIAIALTIGLVHQAGAAPSGGNALSSVAFSATADYCADTEEAAFLTLINNYRAQNGAGPLVAVQTAGAAADHHSIDMATNNYFSHTLYNGISWSQNMTDHGYTYSAYRGENIAVGYTSASSVFTAWKNSSGHNANMLSTLFNAVGIGRASTSGGTWYWTTDFGSYVDAPGAVCGGSVAPTATKTATPQPTATKTPTPQPTATDTPQPTATSTPPPPTATATPEPAVAAYVSSMNGKAATKRGATTMTIVVTVKDTKGSTVKGAGVVALLSNPDGSTQTLSGSTNNRGQVSWSVKATHGSGIYVANVKDVAASNKVYDPTLNAIDSVAVSVP